jgi:hypothetical protein
MIERLPSPQTWIAFATPSPLELVLGIDHLIFMSILVDKLPKERRRGGHERLRVRPDPGRPAPRLQEHERDPPLARTRGGHDGRDRDRLGRADDAVHRP